MAAGQRLAAMEDPTLYIGSVKALLPEKQCGFITCDEARELYGCDVFMHSSQLEGLQEGMQIAFKVQVNAKSGKPQAIEVTPANIDELIQFQQQLHPSWQPSLSGGSGVGGPGGAGGAGKMQPKPRQAQPPKKQGIATHAQQVGQSWIQSVIQGGAELGVPVVLHGIVDATGDFEGTLDAVAKWLGENTRAQASGTKAPRPRMPVMNTHNPIRPAPYSAINQKAPPTGSGNDPSGGLVSDQRFEGQVKAIKQMNDDGRPGFGFITCDLAKMVYGEDVFLHSSQIKQLQIGDFVSFEIQMNKQGKPQAINVVLLE